MAQRRRTDAADRATLTPGAVAEGALALADSAGLEAVTIRRLAHELGVTPMALYWHFRSKDELLDGMADRLHEKIDAEVRRPAGAWRPRLRALLESMVAVLRTHPRAAPLVASRRTTSESGLRTTEAMLGDLREAGFSPTEATQVARHALSTVTDLVVRAREGAAPDEPGETDERRRVRGFLESLPPARYPRLVEAAAPLSACDDPNSHYAFGLDLLMSGVEAMAERRSRSGGA
ncbi:TetR/AcrR family transcriptional regulator C-terminal domain-containing protein [Streptomonospora arabica]|uniref:TetR/AcrR family transcriptional regulator C-terminal domain-containing protein n=1 Tax=Streptomonospora arabica TaxID=412417 RepID=A0ABV9SJ47_9ACTN